VVLRCWDGEEVRGRGEEAPLEGVGGAGEETLKDGEGNF
jgi:hypothetical protein